MTAAKGSREIPSERVRVIREGDIREGEYVLYWMQQSQRAADNHALEFAVKEANSLGCPLVVAFGLMDGYPEANLRHYTFMLEGLAEVSRELQERGITFALQCGEPPAVAAKLARRARVVICDRGYLRHQKAWYEELVRNVDTRVIQVESDVVVPIDVVSKKAEYAARTIRPRIHRHLHRFLTRLAPTRIANRSRPTGVRGEDLSDIDALLGKLRIDRSVPAVSHYFKGGTAVAKSRFRHFIGHGLTDYLEHRNHPEADDVSHMSMHLHFGQVSPVYLACKISEAGNNEAIDSYLEELIVRRELAINFVHHEPHYDSYSCIPEWARRSLDAHRADRREQIYAAEELEFAQTRDRYWNASMEEMRITGFMHNYMRMYWGKKFIEWCESPEEAYRLCLKLNNRYFLDGRDPNGYANVGWIFGLHDRAWGERPIFGKVRYMSAEGLKRKCDIEGYVARINALEDEP